MEYVIGAVTALFILVLGFLGGYVIGSSRAKKPAEDKTEEQEKLDRQWESLFRFDGKEV